MLITQREGIPHWMIHGGSKKGGGQRFSTIFYFSITVYAVLPIHVENKF